MDLDAFCFCFTSNGTVSSDSLLPFTTGSLMCVISGHFSLTVSYRVAFFVIDMSEPISRLWWYGACSHASVNCQRK